VLLTHAYEKAEGEHCGECWSCRIGRGAEAQHNSRRTWVSRVMSNTLMNTLYSLEQNKIEAVGVQSFVDVIERSTTLQTLL
jgi:hypothetical protein